MKAIKDSIIEVCTGSMSSGNYVWWVCRRNQNGLNEMRSAKTYTTAAKARDNFIKFAKLNNIAKYKFI